MKRLLVVFALLLTFSSSAWAEWVNIGSGADGSFIIYADPNTIRKNGSMVKMWELVDYVNAQVHKSSGRTYFSVKHQAEYDCQGERFRSLAYLSYSGKMGGGEPIYNDYDPGQWKPVAPGSVGEGLWELVCGK